MANTGGSYREELENESKQLDPNSHAYRLIAQEIERLKGEDDNSPPKKTHVIPFLDAHQERPQKLSVKIRIPSKEYPMYNFIGKILGPKGQTLKALQEQTGCRMAVMGRGSMRDKDKEEDLRKEGGKYVHLDQDLHLLVECYAEIVDGYHRLAEAVRELKQFVIPQIKEMYDSPEGGMNGAAHRGRGGFRGGPPGGRGGFRGGPPSVRGGRGVGPPSSSRGAPRGRGAPGNEGYRSQGGGSNYDSSFGSGQGAGGDSQYYDSSQYSSQSTGYEYGDAWNSGSGKTAAQSGRGSSRGQTRTHPYSKPSGGGSY